MGFGDQVLVAPPQTYGVNMERRFQVEPRPDKHEFSTEPDVYEA